MPLTMFLRTGLIAGAVLLIALWAFPTRADERAPATISLSGSGEVAATPDMASVTAGVVSEAETARAALDANNEAMERVIAALTDAGIAGRDIQTSGFSVSPRYHYPNRSDGSSEPPQLIGYTVTNQVAVRLRELGRLGQVLDELVSSGANRIDGIAFSIAEPEALLDEARKRAFSDAQRKAQLYAEAAGVTLGQVRSISESGGMPPQPLMQRAFRADIAAEAVPVETGEQSLTVSVQVVWEFGE